MKTVIVAVAVVVCCVVAARGEAYGNYGGGLGLDYKGSQYLQKGHISQYSAGGYAKGYSTYPTHSGYSGYGKKPVVKKEVVVSAPYSVPMFIPPLPVADTSDSIFGGGTFQLFLLFLVIQLLNNNSG